MNSVLDHISVYLQDSHSDAFNPLSLNLQNCHISCLTRQERGEGNITPDKLERDNCSHFLLGDSWSVELSQVESIALSQIGLLFLCPFGCASNSDSHLNRSIIVQRCIGVICDFALTRVNKMVKEIDRSEQQILGGVLVKNLRELIKARHDENNKGTIKKYSDTTPRPNLLQHLMFFALHVCAWKLRC
ncbi:hypothetical protein DVH24_009729 [Malus domestica]|uniref:Uncharacterized protein n=1 Tax=Malus domestica TaxID=3750 RepID=A0A498JPQ5_MALDO|nr:hypothetical protein DVH24_009729 [Malus domestica]